jgi:hypothetical protein
MTIRFYRYSGYPPAPELKEVIQKEHIAGYDAILKELGQVNDENKELWPERMLALDQSLLDKYSRFEDKTITEVSQFEELIKLYGSTLAFCMETRDEKEHLACYIMDLP